MPYTGEEFRRLQRKYNVTNEMLVDKLGVSILTVNNWQRGHTSPPDYIPQTLSAIGNHLQPATLERMEAYWQGVHRIINVPVGTANYWYRTGQFPIAARYAVSAFDAKKVKRRTAAPLNTYQLQRLKHINIATYQGFHSGWRARPVLGKDYPDLTHKTVAKLHAAGYVTISDGRILRTTEKAKKLIYKC